MKRPLIETNPHLRDPVTRRRLLARSVRTSGEVEGINPECVRKAAHIVIPHRPKKLDP